MHDLVVADDAGCDEMYSTWLSALRGRLGRLRLDLLTALAPNTPYSLDFKSPETAAGAAGIVADVTGLGLERFDQDQINQIMATRPGFARPFIHAIVTDLRAAVDRRLPDGGTLQPDQALTPQEAVCAATVDAAASLGTPARGGLAPGEPADLVVCDGDPFTLATRVTQTWIAGTVAWPAPDSPPPPPIGPRPGRDLPAPGTPCCNPRR